MGYYKVKNITNTLAKRDSQKDKDLTIKLNDGLFPIEQTIKSGTQVLIECMKIPTELQKLRVKGFVTIVEASRNEYLSELKELDKPKPPVDPNNKSKKNDTSKSSSSSSSDDSDSSSSSKKSSSSSSSKSSGGKKKTSSSTTEIISEHIKD